MTITSQQIEPETSCSNPLWMGKTCSFNWKKNSPCDFRPTGHVYKTTGCFDMFIKTIHDVNVPWEFKNRAESVARNRTRPKCIL